MKNLQPKEIWQNHGTQADFSNSKKCAQWKTWLPSLPISIFVPFFYYPTLI
jgi:hypothetical protein